MSNAYTWTVNNIVGYPVLGDKVDVVITAFYTVSCNNGDGYTAINNYIDPTPLDPDRPFIPYPELTNDIVVSWIQANLGLKGVESVYANLDAQIQEQINPPPSPESLPLPWA